jgi:hypothetical protein
LSVPIHLSGDSPRCNHKTCGDIIYGDSGAARQAVAALRLLRSPATEGAVIVKITQNDKNNLPGKLAEAELHFTEGILDGLKLIGFTVWERRSGNGRNVTFPARQYTVGGERRTFALLRPVTGDPAAQERLRELILQAYAEHEEKAAVAS